MLLLTIGRVVTVSTAVAWQRLQVVEEFGDLLGEGSGSGCLHVERRLPTPRVEAAHPLSADT